VKIAEKNIRRIVKEEILRKHFSHLIVEVEEVEEEVVEEEPTSQFTPDELQKIKEALREASRDSGPLDGGSGTMPGIEGIDISNTEGVEDAELHQSWMALIQNGYEPAVSDPEGSGVVAGAPQPSAVYNDFDSVAGALGLSGDLAGRLEFIERKGYPKPGSPAGDGIVGAYNEFFSETAESFNEEVLSAMRRNNAMLSSIEEDIRGNVFTEDDVRNIYTNFYTLVKSDTPDLFSTRVLMASYAMDEGLQPSDDATRLSLVAMGIGAGAALAGKFTLGAAAATGIWAAGAKLGGVVASGLVATAGIPALVATGAAVGVFVAGEYALKWALGKLDTINEDAAKAIRILADPAVLKKLGDDLRALKGREGNGYGSAIDDLGKRIQGIAKVTPTAGGGYPDIKSKVVEILERTASDLAVGFDWEDDEGLLNYNSSVAAKYADAAAEAEESEEGGTPSELTESRQVRLLLKRILMEQNLDLPAYGGSGAKTAPAAGGGKAGKAGTGTTAPAATRSRSSRSSSTARPHRYTVYEEVKELQGIIGAPSAKGGDKGDGKWGPKTQAAWEAWVGEKIKGDEWSEGRADILTKWRPDSPRRRGLTAGAAAATKVVKEKGEEVEFTPNPQGALKFVEWLQGPSSARTSGEETVAVSQGEAAADDPETDTREVQGTLGNRYVIRTEEGDVDGVKLIINPRAGGSVQKALKAALKAKALDPFGRFIVHDLPRDAIRDKGLNAQEWMNAKVTGHTGLELGAGKVLADDTTKRKIWSVLTGIPGLLKAPSA